MDREEVIFLSEEYNNICLSCNLCDGFKVNVFGRKIMEGMNFKLFIKKKRYWIRI